MVFTHKDLFGLYIKSLPRPHTTTFTVHSIPSTVEFLGGQFYQTILFFYKFMHRVNRMIVIGFAAAELNLEYMSATCICAVGHAGKNII